LNLSAVADEFSLRTHQKRCNLYAETQPSRWVAVSACIGKGSAIGWVSVRADALLDPPCSPRLSGVAGVPACEMGGETSNFRKEINSESLSSMVSCDVRHVPSCKASMDIAIIALLPFESACTGQARHLSPNSTGANSLEIPKDLRFRIRIYRFTDG
jgi:hypothetical protein